MPRLTFHAPDRCYVGEHRHYTTPEGLKFPGVTTILGHSKPPSDKYALDSWYEREGFESAEEIKNRGIFYGNLTHKRIENFLEGLPSEPHLDWEEEALWNSVVDFLPRVSDVHLIEGAVWHPSGYAGTVDCIARLDGELMLLDWKTARKPKQKSYILDYYLQASAYVQAIEHVYGLRLERAAIVVALRQRKCQVFSLERSQIDDYLRFWKLRMLRWETLREAAKVKLSDWQGQDSPPVSRTKPQTFRGISIE